jgi:hypothetical protein
MNKKTFAVIALLLVPPVLAYALGPEPYQAVNRGRYLVNAFGCVDCHSPWQMTSQGPQPDAARYLSGHPADMVLPPAPAPEGPWIVSAAATNTAWNGPWGTSFTANLTPDEETGLGKWSEEEFIATLRNGRHLGRGRELLPPMPFPAIRNMNDEDLQSIFAYLRTIPAVQNRVPNPLPPADVQ